MQKHLKATALVFAGGALGTAARFGAELTLNQFWMLLIVNVLGTAILGFINGKPRQGWVESFLGTGFAGGFTTMSGVSILLALSTFSELGAAIGFLFVMLGAGFAAYLVGFRVAGSSK
jgi:fluoride ion exporter CrcB/FEX